MLTSTSSVHRHPFAELQAQTRRHQSVHGCGAYTFEDGRALYQIASELRPSRIIELGTALGYTACTMAAGSPKATVDTIEADDEHVQIARAEIARAGLAERIQVHAGLFENVLPKLASGYDWAFFDGFVPSLEIILLLRDRLAIGGILICSNLQLAHREESKRLSLALSDRAHWEPTGSLELGRTRVMRKMG